MGQALMFDDSPKSINRNNRTLKLIALVIKHIKMQMLIVFFQVFERGKIIGEINHGLLIDKSWMRQSLISSSDLISRALAEPREPSV